MQGRPIGVGELLGIGELLLARVSRSPEAGETPWDQGSCPFSKPNPPGVLRWANTHIARESVAAPTSLDSDGKS